MITVEDFVSIFKTWASVLQRQTEGLSRAELFFQPQPGGNCIYWTLGHLIDNLGSMAGVVGLAVPEAYAKYQQYGYDSVPVLADDPGLPGLAQVLADYQQMQVLLAEGLQAKDAAFFGQAHERGGTIGRRLNFLAFHQSYHLGQLETLRNLTGHTEKLI